MQYDDERGEGWLVFAATMLGLAGIMSCLDGIIGLSKSKFYFAGASYVFSDVRTWSWIVLLIGVLLILAAGGVLARSGFSRWFGIFAAVLSAVSHFTWMQVYPLWSITVIAIDIMVIYALAAYGKRLQA
jgi:hypothetical protein